MEQNSYCARVRSNVKDNYICTTTNDDILSQVDKRINDINSDLCVYAVASGSVTVAASVISHTLSGYGWLILAFFVVVTNFYRYRWCHPVRMCGEKRQWSRQYKALQSEFKAHGDRLQSQ